MWLFHFRSGGEQKTNNITNAEGIGHAIRCLRIKKTVEDKFGIKTCVVVNDNFVFWQIFHLKIQTLMT